MSMQFNSNPVTPVVGRIHSIESCGLNDGPGVRFVVFFQGCPLRCAYCHNPDSWSQSGGREVSVEDLMAQIMKMKSYFKKRGGVTFSGGEPLMQPVFLLNLLKACKQAGIHTTIDTSGMGGGKYLEDILRLTDLILLDVKEVSEEGYQNLTGGSRDPMLRFVEVLRHLKGHHPNVWVRHVSIPGMTENAETKKALIAFAEQIPGIEKIEILPYHTHGVHKYEMLGLEYPLKNTPSSDKAVESIRVMLDKSKTTGNAG